MESFDYMSDVYYNYFLNLYEDSKENDAVAELKKIKKEYPNFPFENYVKGIFSNAHINYYGMDFLIKTSKFKTTEIYDYGMKGESQREKVFKLLLSPGLKRLNSCFAMSEDIDIKDLEKLESILKQVEFSEFLNNIFYSPQGINIIKNIINNKIEYTNIIFIAKYFEIIAKEQMILKYISDKDFSKFITNLDTNYLNTKMTLEEFIENYNNFKSSLLNINIDNLDESQKEKFNAAFFGNKIIPVSFNDINDLDDYFNKRANYIAKFIKNNDIAVCKETIASSFFNCSYEQLVLVIQDIKKMLKDKRIKNGQVEKYFIIEDIKTKSELLDFVINLKNEFNLYNIMLEFQKQLAVEDLSNKLNNFSVQKSTEYIYLNGNAFITLLHKVKGYGNYEMATKLYDDPNEWFNNQGTTNYISTSLCNETFFGLVDGNGYVIGFNKVPQIAIIGMGTEDIYMSKKIAKNGLNNHKNHFLLAEDLIDRTHKIYNEVSIRRIVDNKLIVPDFVFVQDRCSGKEQEVARIFAIPIFILNSEIYAKQMILKQRNYLEKQDFKNYIIALKKMYFSFANNFDITQKYFNIDVLSKNLEEIVDTYLNGEFQDIKTLNDLLYMIKEYSKLVDAKSYLEDNGESLEVGELLEKVKKKIC